MMCLKKTSSMDRVGFICDVTCRTSEETKQCNVILLRRQEPEVCQGESIQAGWQVCPVGGWERANGLKGEEGHFIGEEICKQLLREEVEGEIGLSMLSTEYSC